MLKSIGGRGGVWWGKEEDLEHWVEKRPVAGEAGVRPTVGYRFNSVLMCSHYSDLSRHMSNGANVAPSERRCTHCRVTPVGPASEIPRFGRVPGSGAPPLMHCSLHRAPSLQSFDYSPSCSRMSRAVSAGARFSARNSLQRWTLSGAPRRRSDSRCPHAGQ